MMSNLAATGGRVQVVPLTTSVDRLFSSEAFVTLRRRKGKAMADQIATVSKDRLMNRMGKLSNADTVEVEIAIRVQLDLSL